MGWIEGNFRVNKDLIEGDRGWSRTKPSEIKQKTLEIKHIIRKFSNFWHFIILDDRSNLRNTFNFHSFSKFFYFSSSLWQSKSHIWNHIWRIHLSKISDWFKKILVPSLRYHLKKVLIMFCSTALSFRNLQLIPDSRIKSFNILTGEKFCQSRRFSNDWFMY